MAGAAPKLDWRQAAAVIDHTLLRPDATRAQIMQLCQEAERYDFTAVCVQPCWVAECIRLLHATPVKVASVVAFPHGCTLATSKRLEAAELLRIGADELDMVLNVGALKSGNRALIEQEIRSVAELAHAAGALVKVIVETPVLTREEKLLAAEIALFAGADFVKTCTGFGPGGATIEDVALLRSALGARAGVKAAGGIRSASQLQALLQAGATRIGTSASVSILRELGAL